MTVSLVDSGVRLRRADVVVAAATAAVATVGVWQEVVNAPRSVPPAGGAYLLALASAAPLLGRRRAPVLAGIGCLAGLVVYHVAGYPGGAPAMAGFVAVYTVAAQGDGGRSLGAAVGLGVVNGFVVALPPHSVALSNGGVYGPAFGFVAAAFVGEAVRRRTAELQERLLRLDEQRREEALRRAAEERIRIARDLHDIVAHTVAVITVQAAVAADALDSRPEEARAALAVIRQAARDATGELNATVGVLRAGDGTKARSGSTRPTPGLADLGDLIRSLPALAVELRSTGPHVSLPRPVDNAGYRIVQEALTNVLKHAGTDRVAVEIRYLKGAIELEITDRGRGPAGGAGVGAAGGQGGAGVAAVKQGGFGLVGMGERAAAVGGTVSAGPGPSGGFVVVAHLPTNASP